MLALRRDLLPTAYIEELELLHDQLPAMDIDMVRATVEAELGAPLTKFFSAFGETPLAAATIAQVHVATLLKCSFAPRWQMSPISGYRMSSLRAREKPC
ncbi:unusual protein kinase-like [Rhodoferax ferrireducens T118]|uniref:Unusual protein kinase-like n=1 Tax=Albidiferax ferrireducens (strain ATCC BAA-621 / DSM 15236 / T118) TaxID=338969 RepID=Q221X2_ALBFT|nr:unusual protein kinase-like [Rhodoferax ferrireducens T118]